MATRKTFTVNVGSLNLREEPNFEAKVVQILSKGEKVSKVDESAPDGWLAVKGGYVRKEFLD